MHAKNTKPVQIVRTLSPAALVRTVPTRPLAPSMFDKKARQVAMVAADHCDYTWYWATVHAPSRAAALAAILGSSSCCRCCCSQQSVQSCEAAQERAGRARAEPCGTAQGDPLNRYEQRLRGSRSRAPRLATAVITTLNGRGRTRSAGTHGGASAHRASPTKWFETGEADAVSQQGRIPGPWCVGGCGGDEGSTLHSHLPVRVGRRAAILNRRLNRGLLAPFIRTS
jgi:hypothetical protein